MSLAFPFRFSLLAYRAGFDNLFDDSSRVFEQISLVNLIDDRVFALMCEVVQSLDCFILKSVREAYFRGFALVLSVD